MCVHIILVRFGLLCDHLWERAAQSADHMFSSYLTICIFSFFPFWFLRAGMWALIASVPGLCIPFTFSIGV